MVKIFYFKDFELMSSNVIDAFYTCLPEKTRLELLKYKLRNIFLQSLFSKTLVNFILRYLKTDSLTLDKMKFTEFKKPYFDNFPSFNISHTDSLVVLVVTQSGNIGIDTELIKKVSLNDFQDILSPQEFTEICLSKNPDLNFYELWTKKEAVSKLIGAGLNIPFHELVIDGNSCLFNNRKYYLKSLNQFTGYSAFIATEKALSDEDIFIKEVTFDDYASLL